jgi:hypothetical protein
MSYFEKKTTILFEVTKFDFKKILVGLDKPQVLERKLCSILGSGKNSKIHPALGPIITGVISGYFKC